MTITSYLSSTVISTRNVPSLSTMFHSLIASCFVLSMGLRYISAFSAPAYVRKNHLGQPQPKQLHFCQFSSKNGHSISMKITLLHFYFITIYLKKIWENVKANKKRSKYFLSLRLFSISYMKVLSCALKTWIS